MRHNEQLKGISETKMKRCHRALFCLKMTAFCTRMHSYIDVSRVYCRNHWFELGLFAALMFSILTHYLLLLISGIPKKSWTGDFLMKRGYEVTSDIQNSRLRERTLPRVLKIVIKPIGLLQVKRCVYHNSFSGCEKYVLLVTDPVLGALQLYP